MEREYKVGEKVYLRDYPWGKPLAVFGKVVGYLGKDSYNVLLSSGVNSGTIRSFKEWSLTRQECPISHQKQEREKDTTGAQDTLIVME